MKKIKRLIMIIEISVCSALNERLGRGGEEARHLMLGWLVVLENVN